MIRRRKLLASTGIGLFAASLGTVAQTPNRLRRIGMLVAGSPHPKMPVPIEALREALRELGYIEGRTIEIEYRWAEGKADRLPELAAELVRERVELIVAAGDAPTRAAKAATSTLPIVMATSSDAVGAGFVASLARPGGNVTGMTAINPELGAKRLQLLRELQLKACSVMYHRDLNGLEHPLSSGSIGPRIERHRAPCPRSRRSRRQFHPKRKFTSVRIGHSRADLHSSAFGSDRSSIPDRCSHSPRASHESPSSTVRARAKSG